jgi:hypothetical protein
VPTVIAELTAAFKLMQIEVVDEEHVGIQLAANRLIAAWRRRYATGCAEH